MTTRLVLDTNVLVAAGFNRRSHSARLIARLRAGGGLTCVWNAAARAEYEHVLARIPGLDWAQFASLFTPDREHTGPTDPAAFGAVADPDDRIFAALAAATGAWLVSNDQHLLAVREALPVVVKQPGEVLRALS